MDDTDVGRAVRDAIGRELLQARRARDADLVRVQRALLAAIDNAEAVAAPQAYDPSEPRLGATEAARLRLDEAAVRQLFTNERGERLAAAEELRTHGQHEAALMLATEADVVAGYLTRLPDLVTTPTPD